ncbi:MAG TPA: Crp/Fnr family transcriptional regulator [Bryobacteraceae bacterium]|nr:Crp/Fnr family transcriptional regulator [Bryobacteraceae bacterium]
MSDRELTAIAQRTKEVKLRRGEILLLAGDTARGLWVIASGAVRAYRVGSDGREQVIHVERASATVGELPLFDDGAYPSNVVAEEASMLLFVTRHDFHRLLADHPPIAMAALKVLATRLRNCAGLVEALSLHDVDRRLARLLLTEAQGQAGDLVELDLPLTHQQIASRIGSVREVVSRAFGRLSQAGLVRADGKRIIIPSRRELSNYAGSG